MKTKSQKICLQHPVNNLVCYKFNSIGDFSANDGNVANDLLKILGEAGQEVPEFLSNGGIGSYASGGGGTYGGQDIRKGQEAVTNDDDGW